MPLRTPLLEKPPVNPLLSQYAIEFFLLLEILNHVQRLRKDEFQSIIGNYTLNHLCNAGMDNLSKFLETTSQALKTSPNPQTDLALALQGFLSARDSNGLPIQGLEFLADFAPFKWDNEKRGTVLLGIAIAALVGLIKLSMSFDSIAQNHLGVAIGLALAAGAIGIIGFFSFIAASYLLCLKPSRFLFAKNEGSETVPLRSFARLGNTSSRLNSRPSLAPTLFGRLPSAIQALRASKPIDSQKVRQIVLSMGSG
ncbi:MAG TPA: hypothetical protein VJB02_03645 [Coxiellaceae bacterium]|nr:hypothetical protein [Coxiellaceae bacterium]